jgi:DNA-binding transcriptional regulator/RsmH inhibitor MraZ
LAFNDWFIQLSDNQKKELLPENLRSNAKLEKNKMLEGVAKSYFETEIWPDKKRQIVEKMDTGKKEVLEKNE